MTRNQRTSKIAFTGLFAALIFLTTWAIHFPVGVNGGYVHFGDSLVFLSATLLPLPYAMAASAIGAGLSDLMSPGGAVWILPTMIIKPLCCLAFSRKTPSILSGRNVLGMVAGGLTNTVGYFIATAIIAGSAGVALAEIPFSFVQSGGSAVCFLVWSYALDKAHIKNALPAAVTANTERR